VNRIYYVYRTKSYFLWFSLLYFDENLKIRYKKCTCNWKTVYKWGFERYDESLWTPLFGCVRCSVILWILVCVCVDFRLSLNERYCGYLSNRASHIKQQRHGFLFLRCQFRFSDGTPSLWKLSWFSSKCPEKCRDITFFQFIVHVSAYSSTPYISIKMSPTSLNLGTTDT